MNRYNYSNYFIYYQIEDKIKSGELFIIEMIDKLLRLINNINLKYLGGICLAILIIILIAGLWPFNFFPENKVTWFKVQGARTKENNSTPVASRHPRQRGTRKDQFHPLPLGNSPASHQWGTGRFMVKL